jgi:sec-independent protein translocase protein TatC
LAFGLAALLLLPVVAAAPAAVVTLDASGGAWNGRSGESNASGTARLWLPANARVHAVFVAEPTGPTSSRVEEAGWRAEGSDAIAVPLPPNATQAWVEFDLPDSPLTLARFVAPEALGSLSITLAPPAGKAVEAPFAPGSQEGTWTYAAGGVAGGSAVDVKVVDADQLGELPLLAVVAALAVVCFALALVWHRLRPVAPRGGEMRFLDHLVELQARIVPPVFLFALLNVYYFVGGLRAVRLGGVPLVAPTWSLHQSLATRAFDAFAQRQVPGGVQLVVLRPIEAVLAQLEVALFLAFLTILPLLAYEIAVFVGPALRDRERRLAMRTIPLVLLLFALGAAFGYLGMSPLMIRTLYSYAPTVGAVPLLAVGDLVGFVLVVVLAFGLAFELPVAMYALTRLGLVQARTWRRYVRHAILAIFLIAAVITPDPTPVSQFLVAVPVTALYLLGMLAAAWGERARARAGAAVAA